LLANILPKRRRNVNLAHSCKDKGCATRTGRFKIARPVISANTPTGGVP
jgi:hypothetical protein